MGLNERQIIAIQYMREKEKITNKEYRQMFKISDRTALNDLKYLCDKKVVASGSDLAKVQALAQKKSKKKYIPVMFVESGSHIY